MDKECIIEKDLLSISLVIHMQELIYLTKTSAFWLTLRFECALTSLRIVDLGYAFFTAMMTFGQELDFTLALR